MPIARRRSVTSQVHIEALTDEGADLEESASPLSASAWRTIRIVGRMRLASAGPMWAVRLVLAADHRREWIAMEMRRCCGRSHLPLLRIDLRRTR